MNWRRCNKVVSAIGGSVSGFAIVTAKLHLLPTNDVLLLLAIGAILGNVGSIIAGTHGEQSATEKMQAVLFSREKR